MYRGYTVWLCTVDTQCGVCKVDTQYGLCTVDTQCGSCTVDTQYGYVQWIHSMVMYSEYTVWFM